MNYEVLAYYHIGPIDDPHAEVARHKEFFQNRDFRGRIYISEQGINGQASGAREAAAEFRAWLQGDPRFSGLDVKVHPAHEHAFPKMTVKYRRQLVAIDCEVDFSETGERVSPREWKKMLEERDEDTLEFYSAVLKKEGFEKVYQLEGGVIGYGLKEGSDHWKGKLFVFDDRLVVPISEEKADPIAACKSCQSACDVYYNCANMDCNALFLCCPACLEKQRGCCSSSCIEEGRVRPYQESAKPFRKWDYQEKIAMRNCAAPLSD